MLVTFTNSKSGVGKSTLTSNLAIWLFDRGVQSRILREQLAAIGFRVAKSEVRRFSVLRDACDSGDTRFPVAASPRAAAHIDSLLRKLLGDLSRTNTMATVQKPIRFHPKLIAKVDAFIRNQDLRGQRPTPFQQIQNKALEPWLKGNVCDSAIQRSF